MTDVLTERSPERFAQNWFDALSLHRSVEDILPYLADAGLEMVFPEAVLHGQADVRRWFTNVGAAFADQTHIVERITEKPAADGGLDLSVTVIWQATQISDGSLINSRAHQSWHLVPADTAQGYLITSYAVNDLAPVEDPRTVVERYYELANAGQWDAWCDLFTIDQVMDEQLAGHVEGREPLRAMMAGFPRMYSRFSNVPQHIVIEGEQAAVVSHISAETPAGATVEADVVNYFQVRAGLIAYLANYHDTVPFAVVQGN
jgi:ketosteroid isomerase-like protein